MSPASLFIGKKQSLSCKSKHPLANVSAFQRRSYLLLCSPTFDSFCCCFQSLTTIPSQPPAFSQAWPFLHLCCSLLFTHTQDQKAFALNGNPSYQEQQSRQWAETWHHTYQDSYLIFTFPLQAPESMPKGTFVLAVKSPRKKVIAKVLGVEPSQPIIGWL